MWRIGCLVAALWLALAGGAVADSGDFDEDVSRARACFQNSGGPEGCPTVFGWCNAAGSYELRLACRERMQTLWSAVLEHEWTRLGHILNQRDLSDRLDGSTPVAQRIEGEQRAWESYRDARCGWDLPAPEGNITGPEEARFRCLETMSRARAQQIWDLSLYLMTTPLN